MLIYFRDLLAEKTLICLACLSAIAVMFSIILFPPVSSHLLRVYLTTSSGHNGTGSLGCQSGDLAVELHTFLPTLTFAVCQDCTRGPQPRSLQLERSCLCVSRSPDGHCDSVLSVLEQRCWWFRPPGMSAALLLG